MVKIGKIFVENDTESQGYLRQKIKIDAQKRTFLIEIPGIYQ